MRAVRLDMQKLPEGHQGQLFFTCQAGSHVIKQRLTA